MINFALTDEQRQFQSLARQFTREVIIPCAAQYDREERYPEEVIHKAHDLGLLNTLVPEANGGLGLTMMDEVVIGEELGYGCMGIYTILMASELGLTPILVAGSDEQKKTLFRTSFRQPQTRRLRSVRT